MPTFYIDMDGVLVRYQHHAYTGIHPIWLQPGRHYFQHLLPDHTVIGIMSRLHNTGETVKILTALPQGHSISQTEHIPDKKLWIQNHMPWFDINHDFIYTYQNKADILTHTKNPASHILIDDYNINLNAWKKAGGTAVKYLNGINTPNTFDGPHISHEMTPDTIIQSLNNLIKERKTET